MAEPQPTPRRRPVASPLFWAVATVFVAWIVAMIWLNLRLDWPAAYGFHCGGRACLPIGLWHSPALVGRGHGSTLEWLLLALLWLPVAAVAAYAVACIAHVAAQARTLVPPDPGRPSRPTE